MAAQHLGDSNTRLHQSLIDMSPVGIAILDESGKILYSNPAFCEVMGAAAFELKYTPLAQLAPSAARNYVQERVATAVNQGGARCKWAAEQNRAWVELFIERAIKSRTDFLIVRAWRAQSHHGHSLNGHSTNGVSRSEHSPAAPATTAAATQVVVPSTEFAVVATAEAPLEDSQTVDVSGLAADVADDLRRRTGANPAIKIQPQMTLRADPGLLRLVLQHLIDNAMKFAPPGDTARVEIGQSDGVLFVRDHGIGFEPSQAANIFQPFERLPEAQAYPGAGIGLASVKRIVERLGGMVWAISKPGRGATFFVRL